MDNGNNTPEDSQENQEPSIDNTNVGAPSVTPQVGDNPFTQPPAADDTPIEESDDASGATQADDAEMKAEELLMLKQKADSLGISYHTNIGYQKLYERLQDHIELEAAKAKDAETDKINAAKVQAETVVPVRAVDQVKSARQIAREDAMQLIRVNIACLNPLKKAYEGEIFTASNSVVGTVKKFVPFNQDFHVPQIILNGIKEAQFMTFVEKTDAKGRPYKEKKLVTAYAINVLAPLTQAELDDLRRQQAMAAGK